MKELIRLAQFGDGQALAQLVDDNIRINLEHCKKIWK